MQQKKSRVRGTRNESWHPKVADPVHRRIRSLLRRQASWRWLTAILLLYFYNPGVGLANPGSEAAVTPAQVQSGSLLLRMKSGYVVATRINTEIAASVSGRAARVRVRQEFRNDGTEWVEGVYVFPLPDTAAVDHMRMYIGERFIEGDIREKEKARKEYEAAKNAGKKTSLVEQQRANLFTTSVANIGPRETVAIEIEYLESIRFDEGSFSLRFPLTITPRYISGTPLPDRKGSGWSPDTTLVRDASLVTPPVITRSGDHKVHFDASIDAGVPLEFVASRYHPIEVDERAGRYDVSLRNPNVPTDHDLELTWRPVADRAPRATVFSEVVDGQEHLLVMLLPPNDVSAPITRMPRQLVFIVDTSGSMHGTSLTQAKRALTLALDGLQPGDRFNVIQFNSVTNALFPGAVEATSTNIGIAKRYVGGLKANGGTEMRPALVHALTTEQVESHLSQVIFITDGSVGNEQELFGLIEKKLGRTRLFTVGIGSAPNSWFMRKAAEAGAGTFTLISALHEVNEKMGRLFRKLEQPQVTDIAVDWPDGASPEMYPHSIPDLYAGEPVVLRARLAAAPRSNELLRIGGSSVLGTWDAELELATEDSNPGVAALWARAKIESLLDRERQGADPEETRRKIIETALAHHLVSKYTSLVAVDKTPVRPQSANLSKEQVPNLLPYGQSTNAIFGFPATATGAGSYRLQGMLLITAALLLLLVGDWRRRRAASIRA